MASGKLGWGMRRGQHGLVVWPDALTTMRQTCPFGLRLLSLSSHLRLREESTVEDEYEVVWWSLLSKIPDGDVVAIRGSPRHRAGEYRDGDR
jgi:hypothetical protein